MSPTESRKNTGTHDARNQPGGSRPSPDYSRRPEPDQEELPRRRPISWQTVVRLMLLALVLVFAILNTQTITLNLIFTKLEMPLFVVIFGSVALGAIIALLDARRRRRRSIRQ